MKTHTHTNKLAEESSPYLLQHAANPVFWYPWGNEALQKAREEDKPIIVSIGYSSCHWCHVMERESFENKDVAEVMNKNFICIKVDREERPDVDQIYMEAIQAMGIQGGWPLNVFLNSDQKPFYGGTYFPNDQWIQLLKNVADAYKNQRVALDDSAEKFTEALNFSDIEKYRLQDDRTEISKEHLATIFNKLSAGFDTTKGGMNKAPKFPMPGIWSFIIRYISISEDDSAKTQLKLTLDRMAAGGIYDQIGGGFSRYSVDNAWFAPHFEKMLYDNGQLLSLYAEAYRLFKSERYKEVIYQTVDWLQREMMSSEGGFYAALDADSEGEEGKFYTWTWEDFHEIAGTEGDLFAGYYNLKREGNWEKGWNILHTSSNIDDFIAKKGLNSSAFKDQLRGVQQRLLTTREKRVRPGLDDKILTGWNGIMLQGIIDAYRTFGDPDFIALALKNATFIKNELFTGINTLCRSYKNGKASLSGYLEDYAYVIKAYTSLYQVTFDQSWLDLAESLTAYVIDNFYDDSDHFFYFADTSTSQLIARKKELLDNVIPASNSIMALNLYELGILLDKEPWQAKAETMVKKAKSLVIAEPQYMNTWAIAYLNMAYPTAEIATLGPEAKAVPLQIGQRPIFNVVYAGTEESSFLPLLKKRTAIDGKTTIYVCYGRACQLPVHHVEDAIKQLKFS